eukprot:CAMPEP_0116039816 /NCGR_PEP_ID=MMETSP0321-20121206/23886_1 /TAXON_ID=163516 /ORGANISM="Leptocylindrus danicus var. danicus, Strain B650" /LENGTH=1054 /DNA_ID=CAMNT_0003519307 /DNA_START=38 /DNA_END=3202 /DNA_ORIENTATION=+
MPNDDAYQLDVDRFAGRIEKLHAHIPKHGSVYNTKTILFTPPISDSENPYAKSKVMHTYLFGYELPDTLLLLTETTLVFVGSKKKCEFLRPAVGSTKKIDIEIIVWNKKDGVESVINEIADYLPAETNTVGVLKKEYDSHTSKLVVAIKKTIGGREIVDVSHGLSLCLGVKAPEEAELLQKSAVLTNKVLKHFFIPRLENIIDEEISITHENLAQEVEAVIEQPEKINLKVPQADVESCYFPILQSGGSYDLKVSAQSSDQVLKHDIIIASLGARYKMYCSNVARTFLIDPPKHVNAAYDLLLRMQEAVMKEMIPGRPLKSVRTAAAKFLKGEGREDLIACLPKSLGFAVGIDFKDSALQLNSKNSAPFRNGMIFYLGLGLQNIPHAGSDKTYALMIGDTVSISIDKANLLTKHAKELTNVTYIISKDEESDAGSDSSDDDVGGGKNDKSKSSKSSNGDGDALMARDLDKSSKRSSARTAEVNAGALNAAADREKKQIQIMKRRNEERLRELARSKATEEDEENEAEELSTYRKTSAYPEGAMGHVVKVDMTNEAILLPINGMPTPFHISTIKSVVLPDPDNRATYLRINFYGAGQAVPKDASPNIAKLIAKHSHWASFVREVTLRSLDGNNLTQAYRQIAELRKRFRNRITRDLLQSTLVTQDKLQRIKNERISRLSDVTMRPVLSGRKTQGNLEVHANGLRFVSQKGELLDIMYNNIQNAIFQPCESEVMVLLHFHLKNDIMIGKKKHNDVQFYTEVVDVSLQVDNRTTIYDPDEMDDEQRERQLRKKLNMAFKEFARKVESTAKKYDHDLEFDVPYRDLGFYGTPHREMVFLQPTLHSLINVTETPFCCVPLDEIDHVHFERITFASKAFDMVFINKDFSKQPWRVDMVGNDDKDSIQDWLTDMEISFTEGPMNLNWKQIMNTISGDDRFYEETEDDLVTPKEAGWEFLRMVGKESDESDDDDEEDDEYSEDGEEEESGSETEESEDYASESSEGSYRDDDLEEEGMDWDDMEREAAASDRRKSNRDAEEEEGPKKRRRGSNAQPTRKRRR